LELLVKQGIKPILNEYLISPPTAEKIKEILRKLGYAPRDLMRKKEDAYIEHNLDNQTLSDDYLIDFMIKHPILIERPIVLANEKAAIGRPPEKVLEIL
jgi:arsenate reductase